MCHGARAKVGWIKEYHGLTFTMHVALLLARRNGGNSGNGGNSENALRKYLPHIA